MRRFGRVPGWAMIVLGATGSLIGSAGCGQNSIFSQGNKKPDEQVAMKAQFDALRNRADSLDQANLQRQTELAQSLQRARLLEDQLSATRQQLGDMTAKYESAKTQQVESDERVKAMTASMQRRGSVTIEPNSSIQRSLPEASLPGIETRRDGDVIRVVLPADRLFESNLVQFRPGADKLIAHVGNELRRVYPQQMIAVEGHTDSSTPPTSQYRTHHELSVAWAMAVQQILTSQTQLQPRQLLVTGHGANHPGYSNGAPGGQQRNRRVELVVYPDRVGGF